MLGISRASLISVENETRQPKANELIKYSQIFDMSLDVIVNPKQEKKIDMSHFNEKKFRNLLLYILTKC
jgi:DNA-binding XRE family transcriptional regulator